MPNVAEMVATYGSGSVEWDALVAAVVGGPVQVPLEGLQSRTLNELAAMPGMSRSRAVRLLAAMEVGKRALVPQITVGPLSDGASVARHCAGYSAEPNELFIALVVNARNRIVGEYIIARGWESGVNLTERQVYTRLLKEGAGRVIFVHNHPSGDPTPSPEDVRFTRKLIDGARLLGLKVLDHVIVASGGHASMRQNAGRDDLCFG